MTGHSREIPHRERLSADAEDPLNQGFVLRTAQTTSGPILAYNAILSFLGLALPLLVGIALVPFIARRLGEEGLGVLSLGWTILSLSLLFNLGLGRATTKYAAELVGQGELTKLPSLFWSSLAANTALGAAGGIFIALGAVTILSRVLKISDALAADARAMFVYLAFAIPFLFATTTLRGMLEAGQYFGPVNLVKAFFNALLFVLPAVAISLNMKLPAIGLILAISRVAEALAYLWLCLRTYPVLGQLVLNTDFLRPLASYGGWLTVSSVLRPLFVHLDRFVIGSLISVSAVAYYAVPVDVITRLVIVPASVVLPLFPAFSALSGTHHHHQTISRFYIRSTKYVLLIMGPVIGVVIALARPFLLVWVGDTFAANGTAVLQVMAIGVLANSISYLPYTLLQSVGRPDLTAKLHLLEVPIAALLLWYLTWQFGIVGAAVAWTIRVVLDGLLLGGATYSLGYVNKTFLSGSRVVYATVLVVLFLCIAAGSLLVASLPLRVAAVFVAGCVYAPSVWFLALDQPDHELVSSLLRKLISPLKKAGAHL